MITVTIWALIVFSNSGQPLQGVTWSNSPHFPSLQECDQERSNTPGAYTGLHLMMCVPQTVKVSK